MRVLIVAGDTDLSGLWADHLERQEMDVYVAHSQEEAVDLLTRTFFSVIVLDLILEEGSAMAVADYADYRWPEARVIFVNRSGFFSDGSIFQHCGNAAAMVPAATEPKDLAALAQHYSSH